jgi:hypothetical protein
MPTSTTIYTLTATTSGGCTATNTVTVTINSTGDLALATTNNVSSTTGNTNQTFTQNDGVTHTYTGVNCNVIATVNDGVGGNVLGSTISTVVVDATVQTYNTQPYVRRHYTITPTNQGAATVTLYLTQADFNDYNANNGAYLDLPTGPTDATGIANVRITKVNGVLGVDATNVITPTLTWDATNMYWTATFPVTSFSSFYFHAVNPDNAPLPVTLLSFTGKKEASANVLNWVTSTEQNNAYFTIERSEDATNFIAVGKVNTKAINGNSSTILKYELQDEQYKLGHNYYRLLQTDIENKTTIESKIIYLYRDIDGTQVNVYPNPATNVLNIDIVSSKSSNATIKLMDMTGRIVQIVHANISIGSNTIQLDIQSLAKGIYTLQTMDNTKTIATQKVEKK